MNCPHCFEEIPDDQIAIHLAAKGGKAANGKKKRRGDTDFYRKLAAMRKTNAGGRPPTRKNERKDHK